MKKIKVKIKNGGYPVYISSGLNKVSGLHPDLYNKNAAVVIDKNVEELWGGKIIPFLQSLYENVFIYSLKPGERSKSFTELNKIYSFLLENKLGRDTMLIAVGGGVTGDLAGYAAATFMRGLNLIHFPTTLLAAADSSIGGKTGINFKEKKNIIGSFYQPEAVFINTDFLSTLPQKEIASGIGEIVKYAFLSDKDFFNYVDINLDKIYKLDKKTLNKIIMQAAAVKAGVVSQDEKEAGLRKILNLGHTFAHAFESELNFKIRHGEAVTAGIIASLFLSEKLKIIREEKLSKFLSLPKKINLPNKFFMMNKENLYENMMGDKKSRSGKIKFVLVQDIGRILIDVEASKEDIFYALDRAFEVVEK